MVKECYCIEASFFRHGVFVSKELLEDRYNSVLDNEFSFIHPILYFKTVKSAKKYLIRLYTRYELTYSKEFIEKLDDFKFKMFHPFYNDDTYFIYSIKKVCFDLR